MSITEKLAQCVRFCEPYLIGRVAALRRSGGSINNDAAIEVESDLAALRAALAEYDAAPAGEVTADAVLPADAARAAYNDARSGGNTQIFSMQAALAAAFPALVQQVERLTAEVERTRRSVLSEELHALRAQVTEKTK